MVAIYNRRASFDYEVLEKFEVGIVLTGREVKALRAGRADITQAHAKIMQGQLMLINATITTPQESVTRMRKLLAHRKEITALESKIQQKKLTLVPLSLYTKDHRFKLELGLVRSKKEFSKKKTKQKRDQQRDFEREFKDSTR